MNQVIPSERIESHIYLIRGQKVMLSVHLADLYQVEPKVLVQAVKRNIERFPSDFMFQLTNEEFEILKSQIVTSSWGGLRRAHPYAFTEQGIAMLSAVLRSPRAIKLSTEIVRAFVRLRTVVSSHKVLARTLHQFHAGDFREGIEPRFKDVAQAAVGVNPAVVHMVQAAAQMPVFYRNSQRADEGKIDLSPVHMA
ncbi:MAG TPA: DNA-binding protein [Deltaproteobacteria bacterium]|nr:DNA-binding protein [Deltaproteobacteria bacterium]